MGVVEFGTFVAVSRSAATVGIVQADSAAEVFMLSPESKMGAGLLVIPCLSCIRPSALNKWIDLNRRQLLRVAADFENDTEYNHDYAIDIPDKLIMLALRKNTIRTISQHLIHSVVTAAQKTNTDIGDGIGALCDSITIDPEMERAAREQFDWLDVMLLQQIGTQYAVSFTSPAFYRLGSLDETGTAATPQ